MYSAMKTKGQRSGPLRQHVADAADSGAYGLQLLFYFFVAAVDVVAAVDDGLRSAIRAASN